MKYKKIVVAGGGILGSQIAYQTAYAGYNVNILIRKEDNKEDVVNKLYKLHDTYIDAIKQMSSKENKSSVWCRGIADIDNFDKADCLKNVDEALTRINILNDQTLALDNADLLIESVTEDIKVKEKFYKSILSIIPEKTVIVTNSSTLLPSKLAKSTGRPDKFLSMHFANAIWKNNISEVMGHDKTEKKYFDEIVAFAKSIRMIPLPVYKEKSGYLLNSLLVPFLLSAMDLLANGVSDPQTIDNAWTLGTGAPNGPFEILDVVGLETAKNIVLQYQKVPNIIDPLLKKMMLPYNYSGMLKILNQYIEEGKMGKVSGEGFFKYDKK